jgi:hypothetical protein
MTRVPLLAALLLAACGGSSIPPASTPAREEQDQAPQAQPPPPPGYGQPSPEPAQPLGPSGAFAEEPPLSLAESLAAFEHASAELSSADLDCSGACKAFQSMQRASERICALNGPDDPGARCRKAKARLDTARETVRRRCGSCEG